MCILSVMQGLETGILSWHSLVQAILGRTQLSFDLVTFLTQKTRPTCKYLTCNVAFLTTKCFPWFSHGKNTILLEMSYRGDHTP